MDTETWWATVHKVAESDATEATQHTRVHRGNLMTPVHVLKFDFTDSSQIMEVLSFFNYKTNPLCFQENVENLNMEVQT